MAIGCVLSAPPLGEPFDETEPTASDPPHGEEGLCPGLDARPRVADLHPHATIVGPGT